VLVPRDQGNLLCSKLNTSFQKQSTPNFICGQFIWSVDTQQLQSRLCSSQWRSAKYHVCVRVRISCVRRTGVQVNDRRNATFLRGPYKKILSSNITNKRTLTFKINQFQNYLRSVQVIFAITLYNIHTPILAVVSLLW